VLVGISGGPDSACLLLTLAALRPSLVFRLDAAYFDHRLRGPRAAAREERFVRSLTEALAVPLHCGAGDVRAHARAHRRSLEEAARELRYRFLAEAAGQAGCHAVAVGHTRDDQAETLLLHLLRGSGLRGLAAMAPSTSWPLAGDDESPRLVRPLLTLSRQDTEGCCREAGLLPLRDPSNRSRSYLRNRIRRELLPLLRRYNPRIDDALVRLAGAAAADIDLLEGLAAEALAGEPSETGVVRLARRSLAALPPALQHHAVRLAVARLLGDARGLADRHLRSLLRASEGPTGARLDLARGLRVEVEREAIVLSTAPPRQVEALPEGEVTLPTPGSARFGPWRFQAALLRRPPPDLSSSGDPCLALLDADACGRRLWLRRRRRGDRFHPLGLPEPKKLQDFFVDAHVPRALRDSVPLVCGDRGIAWVVGQRPAEWAKVTAATRRVLRLRASLERP
jgi:tRNA(Ile)-lysidine synthase